MCGILGSINIPFGESLLNTIEHRGPDDFGIEKYNVNGNLVTFGQRRLSIVDLSPAGHQPMITDCNNYLIIFNGEIYNHLKLKEALPTTIDFKGYSDTETILYYIKTFGIDSVDNLNGIFAFAYLDVANNLLHIVRDRYGVKPLYYYYNNNKLIFASELRPIRYLINSEIDFGAIGNCLRMRYFPAPLTPFKGVSKLEPGQLMTIKLNPDNLDIRKSYFVNKRTLIHTEKLEQSSLVKKYGDLFEKAVERQLMADVDIGILLSGGIDSALVAAIAKSKSKRSIKAFTIGFENRFNGVDETSYASETASALGIGHYVKECGFEDFLGSIKRIVEIVEEPIGTTSIIPMYFLAELAASKVKVVLSGQGADEPLGGYFKYKALPSLDIVRNLKFVCSLIKLIEPFCQKNENVRRVLAGITAEDQIKSYMHFSAISSFDQIYKLFNPSCHKAIANEICQKQQKIYGILDNRNSKPKFIKDLFPYFDLRTSLPDDLLMYTDKLTMHFGLECRVPILDNDLVEFIESLHSSKKFNFWKGKIIHKLFAKEYLPTSIVNRIKVGFDSPTEFWFRENREEIQCVFNSNLYFKSVFSIDKVNKIISDHSNGINLEKQIFLLLTINYFLESVNETKYQQKANILTN